MILLDFYIFSACYPLSDFRIQLIYRITAGSLHIVVLIPFKAGDEEQRQYRVCHEYPEAAHGSACSTCHYLVKIKVLSPVCYSHHEKHIVTYISTPLQ